MNNEIYARNIKALKSKRIYKGVYECIVSDIEEYQDIFIDKSVNGEDIIGITKNDKTYYFNSRYNDDEFTNNWMKSINDINYQSKLIIFGGSNYLAIRKLMKILGKENALLIYEPDRRIFLTVIKNIDISDIIMRENIVFAIHGINENYLQEFIIGTVSYSTMKLVKIYDMWNYSTLYSDIYKEIYTYIYNEIEKIVLTRNTLILFSKERGINTISNCRDFINQYSLNKVLHKFKEIENLVDIPAILVAAGPSLDKNIGDLKKAKGKAFIVAVDTAIKSMLKRDIIPDFVVTVDGHKPPVVFAHSKFNNINMLVNIQSNRNVINMHNGKRFYFNDTMQYVNMMYAKANNELLMYTESGGSVANNGFSLLNILGFKKIILIGQDLAYPDMKEHVEDAYGVGGDIISSKKKYIEVEDIYGKIVLTEYNMDTYRKWFENQIIRYPELEVIDATEGGARISGTKIMKFSEAIDKYCKIDIDFKKILDEIEPAFSEQYRDEFNCEMSNMELSLLEMKGKICEGIKDYDRLDMLNRKGKVRGKEFKDLLARINKLSDEIINMPIMDFVSIFNQKEEFDVLEEVFQTKDNVYDDIADVIKSGKKMLQSYIKAIDETIKTIKEIDDVTQEEVNQIIQNINNRFICLKESIVANKIEETNKELREIFCDIAALVTALKAYEKSGKDIDNKIEIVLNVAVQVEKCIEDNKLEELVKDITSDKLVISNI